MKFERRFKKAMNKAVVIAGNQAALAKLLGVSPIMVSSWKNRREKIPAERAAQIENLTGVQFLDLIEDKKSVWSEFLKRQKSAK